MSSTSPRRRLDSAISDLFGSGIDWRRETGLLQVAAIDARGRSMIAIGPGAPPSASDRFILGFARARADAIVTTGAILRAEPHLVHRYSDDDREDAAWRDWRAEQLGGREPPCLLILTRSGELPLAHPALTGRARTLVWTSPAGQARLGRAVGEFAVVVGDRGGPHAALQGDRRAESPSGAEALSAAYHWLRAELGAETVVVEAGARATQGLYEAGDGESTAAVQGAAGSAPRLARLDELLLSVYAGAVPTAVAGPAFPSTELLARYFSRASHAPAGGSGAQPRTRVRVEEPSGAWLFERYRRDRRAV